MGLASFVMLELAICAGGTYETFSWDIMEPISYLMGLLNFFACFSWYCRFLNEPAKQSPVFWFRDRSTRKMQRKAGYSSEELALLMKEITELKNKLEQNK